jgi:outer membrane protein OmpA-like peptidoglycan-associated protein
MEKVETHVLVTFASSSAFLADDAKGRLRQVLPFARTANRIVISGRTDDVGDKGVNEKLALARALAVRNFLRDEAPDLPGVISIDARGLCCFVAPNDPPGRAKNRRVELVFMGNEVM